MAFSSRMSMNSLYRYGNFPSCLQRFPIAIGTRMQLDLYTILSTNSPSDRKSTRLNSSHTVISYAVFCLKKKKKKIKQTFKEVNKKLQYMHLRDVVTNSTN